MKKSFPSVFRQTVMTHEITNAVFTLGIFTAVKEFTYLGKFLVNVNIN